MKIIVFDDDPTGSQTLNNCLLLLKWDYETLLKGLQSRSNIFFILANTRSLSEIEVKARLKEICESLLNVFSKEGYNKEDFIFVSRGDSTLRGHNYLEANLLNDMLGPFDATFHIPAFIEANRVTIDGKHFVDNVPAHETIYARDKIFGYETSDIKTILYKKSNSMILFKEIQNLLLSDLNDLEMTESNKVFKRIYSLKNNIQVIVDAKEYKHLEKISSLVKSAMGKKRFLFRTAASFLTAISAVKVNTINNELLLNMKSMNSKNQLIKGLIVVGSFVSTTNDQLYQLLKINSCKAIELNVSEFYRIISLKESNKDLKIFKSLIIKEIRKSLKVSITPVLFTSRNELLLDNDTDQICFYNSLSKFIAEIVGDICYEINYLISKGGITSNNILSHGLKLDSVYLKGQILKGISLVEARIRDTEKIISIVTFPGNIGNKDSLIKVWQLLEEIN